jgi:hypothetical protein
MDVVVDTTAALLGVTKENYEKPVRISGLCFKIRTWDGMGELTS